MDRRETLRALAVGSLSVSAFLTGCDPKKSKEVGEGVKAPVYGRTDVEKKRDAALESEKFFTPAEMKTITVLADIIIPADEHSGSASEANVPEFIEFIVKDMPKYKTPMRGGLRWLDIHSTRLYNNGFTDCSSQQQLALIDQIAYPEKATPEMSQGVAFFSLMRDFTANAFFTSKIGIKDLGYMGNTPNEWDGVPADVLKQYGLAYDEKMLAECLKVEDRGKLMTWD
ncbi:Gluconate 2-dehydrogenase subunit 3 [Chitinophaga sp. CF118]|uniref:gluconate 2-dehydrogenase subunit 3 family protein n=1 Tax=Chitinophaga sp. CF118 TaxID=1884367 RepID=UPI0008F1E53E|nr:gluconate 2-dehydrogenase subunit 3 family protein [Chitinophaga sp. CF118]SFE69500.1 Gluconate 2-dehydrogenase subunit 3 [Chitinophaga sp. CF118]